MSFAVVLTAYWLYALVVVPWIEPAIDLHAQTSSSEWFQESDRDRQILEALFPPGAWELDQPKVFESRQTKLLFKDYTKRNPHTLELRPCTLIFFPEDPGLSIQERAGRAVVLEAPEGAVLEFDQPLDLTLGKMGRLVRGQLQGMVRIRSQGRSAGPEDDLRITTREVRLSQKEITTSEKVEGFWGPHFARGQDLHIELSPASSSSGGLSLGGLQTVELRRVELVHIEVPAETSRSLRGRVSSSKDATATPPGIPLSRSHGLASPSGGSAAKAPTEKPPLPSGKPGPGQPAGLATACSADPSASEGDEESPLAGVAEITCKGPFRFDAKRWEASFAQQVVVQYRTAEGPTDTLRCDRLLVVFQPQAVPASKKTGSQGAGGSGVTGPAPSSGAKAPSASENSPAHSPRAAGSFSQAGTSHQPSSTSKAGATGQENPGDPVRTTPSVAGSAQSSAAEQSNKGSSSVPRLVPQRLEAIGQPVILEAPSRQTRAVAERLEYHLSTGRILLQASQDAWICQGPHEIHAQKLDYTPGVGGQVGQGVAEGAGWLRAETDPRTAQTIQARWTQALQLRPLQGQPVLSLLGQAEVLYTGIGQLAAEQIHLWIRQQPASDQPAGRQVLAPDRLLAEENVLLRHPQVTAQVDRLEAWFDMAAPMPLPLGRLQQPASPAAAPPGAPHQYTPPTEHQPRLPQQVTSPAGAPPGPLQQPARSTGTPSGLPQQPVPPAAGPPGIPERSVPPGAPTPASHQQSGRPTPKMPVSGAVPTRRFLHLVSYPPKGPGWENQAEGSAGFQGPSPGPDGIGLRPTSWSEQRPKPASSPAARRQSELSGDFRQPAFWAHPGRQPEISSHAGRPSEPSFASAPRQPPKMPGDFRQTAFVVSAEQYPEPAADFRLPAFTVPSGPSPEMPVDSRPPAASPPGPPVQQHFEVRCKLLRALIVLAGQQAELKELILEGEVFLSETQTAHPDEKPLVVLGRQIHVLDASRPYLALTVRGEPAHVEARGLALNGPAVHLHRGTNRLWIDGPGWMSLPMDRDLHGRPTGRTAQVDVHWQHRMDFDGRSVRFEESVLASSPGWQLRTDSLEVQLREPVVFTSPKPASNVQVHRLICRSDVLLENRSWDAQGELSRDQIEVADLTVDLITGDLAAGGPGVFRSVRRSQKKQADPNPSGQTEPAGAGKPARSGPFRPDASGTGLLFLSVEFQRSLVGNLHRREISFSDRVRTIYGPVADWQERIPWSQLAALPPQVVFLSCDQLSVVELAMPPSGQRFLELLAVGNTVIESAGYTARAHRLSYTEHKGLVVLEGDGRADAELFRQQRPGAPRERVAARKIYYWPQTNHLTLDSASLLEVLQPDKKR